MSTFDWKHWVLTHLIWVAVAGTALVGYRTFIAEHDARLKAETTIAKDEQTIKGYQDQITATQTQIATLQEQMNARDAASAKQLQQLSTLVSKVQTPQQAVAALPSVVQLPAPVESHPDGSVVIPAVDAVPLFSQLADGKQCAVQLQACQGDLKDETKIADDNKANYDTEVKIVAQKQDEITALKKKPSFWKRVGSTLKEVGIGVGIGLALGHHF